MSLVAIILAGFVVLALVAARVERSYIAPATVWPAAWAVYAAAAVPYMADPLLYAPALSWILLNCGVFLLGAVLSRALPLRDVSWSLPPMARFPALEFIVAVLAISGIASLVLTIRTLGFALSTLLSIEGLAHIAAASRGLYTFGEGQQGPGARVLLVLAYTGTPFGGVCCAVAERRLVRALAIMPLATIVLIGVVLGSRMGVLFGGSLWLAAFLSGRLLGRGHRPDRDRRLFALVGAVAVALLAGLSTAVQAIRYMVGSRKTADLIVADPFGFLAAFATWFANPGPRENGLSAGFYVFERIGRMLGADRMPVPAVDVGFTSSNVYTVLRALIDDFGLGGSLVVVLGLGFLGSLSFRAVVGGRAPWLATLAMVYAFLLAGMALSVFAYTGPTIGAACFVGYCALTSRPRGMIRQLLDVVGQPRAQRRASA